MNTSYIKHISYYFPETEEWNDTTDPLTQKIGIPMRYVAKEDEYVSTLAYRASLALFQESGVSKEEIDMVLLCTQSPDYILPGSASIVHNILGLSANCGAVDINLGCSGYVYSLSLAKGLIESKQANNILVINADTYTKYIRKDDRTLHPLFGDAASATLVSVCSVEKEVIGPFVFGTDGSGVDNLIVHSSGVRGIAKGNNGQQPVLYMNGREIFKFAYLEVPKVIDRLLEKEGLQMDDYDYVVLHQANAYMMEQIRKKMNIPKEKFSVQLKGGNTVSASIPIALRKEFNAGNIGAGSKIMIVGFGVGYSWAAASIIWNPLNGGHSY
jgi:3-oxoacyl-[acyl-carrier-protein] synthase-3